MNKIILNVAAAGVAAFGLISAASAEGRDPAEKAGYEQAIQSVNAPKTVAPAVVLEGRNAATNEKGVEPYIAQSIEQDARSN